jgi:hypothetical protein
MHIYCNFDSIKHTENLILYPILNCQLQINVIENQSTEGAEFVWVSECQKGEDCEIINQFVFVKCHQCFPVF